METIMNIVGQRLRAFRQKKKMTQEELAEKADLHPTYIGQVERGEKNLTLISLEKILAALEISFTDLFEHIEPNPDHDSPAALCYELVNRKTPRQQAALHRILQEIDQLMP